SFDVSVGDKVDLALVADFNDDGRPDLLACGLGGGSANVVSLLSDGGYSAPVSLDAGSSLAGAAVGDFNGDGLRDVVISDSAYQRMLVYEQSGGRLRLVDVQAVSDAGVGPVAAIDLDGDGRDDYVFGDQLGAYRPYLS